MTKLKPCGCHYEFRPNEAEFQIAVHLCPKHFTETMDDHDNQPARRWKWPDKIITKKVKVGRAPS